MPKLAHSDFDLQPRLTACLACGSEALSPGPLSLDDQWSIAGFTSSVCRSCGSTFTNPRPTPASLGRFYDVVDREDPTGFIQASLRYYTNPGRAAARRQNYLAPLLARKPAGKLLDFGAGAGWFMKLAADVGYDVHGLEFMQGAVDAGRAELGLETLRQGAEDDLPTEPTYDVIVCNNLIEHLIDPFAFAEKCRAALRPGGVVMMAFPSADSAMFRALGEHSYYFMTPYHLTHFTRRGMAAMIDGAGFARSEFQGQPEAYYWGRGVAHKLGLTEKYEAWREDPDFVRFDIAMDDLLADVSMELDSTLNELAFAWA